jgi:hypothetical protein
VRVALAAALALAATALAVVLSGSPLIVAGTNSVPANSSIGVAKGGSKFCQSSGTVPRGTSAIRISASQNTGPSVRLTALSGSQIIAQGEQDAGWGVAETVTVPVKRVPRATPNASICTTFGPAVELIELNGGVVQAGNGTTGRALRVEYLRPGPASWWSLAPSVAHRMGFGHAPSGTWIVFALIALMITVATLASRMVLRELR